MTEDVGTGERCFDVCSPKGTGHDGSDGVARDRLATTGLGMLHEHSPLLSGRALLAQVRDDRATGLAREREIRAPAGLAYAQVNGAGAPVDILEPEVSDLARPKPQGRQAQHDRAVPVSA